MLPPWSRPCGAGRGRGGPRRGGRDSLADVVVWTLNVCFSLYSRPWTDVTFISVDMEALYLSSLFVAESIWNYYFFNVNTSLSLLLQREAIQKTYDIEIGVEIQFGVAATYLFFASRFLYKEQQIFSWSVLISLIGRKLPPNGNMPHATFMLKMLCHHCLRSTHKHTERSDLLINLIIHTSPIEIKVASAWPSYVIVFTAPGVGWGYTCNLRNRRYLSRNQIWSPTLSGKYPTGIYIFILNTLRLKLCNRQLRSKQRNVLSNSLNNNSSRKPRLKRADKSLNGWIYLQ